MDDNIYSEVKSTNRESERDTDQDQAERMSDFYRLFAGNHQLFVNNLLHENHGTSRNINPDCGFLAGFAPEHLEVHSRRLAAALRRFGRKYVEVDAYGLTLRQLATRIHGGHCLNDAEASISLRRFLWETDKVLVIRELSQAKFSPKGNLARYLIKSLDDAHFENIYPESDLIFIDYAAFLQRIWDDAGDYLKIMVLPGPGRMSLDYDIGADIPPVVTQ